MSIRLTIEGDEKLLKTLRDARRDVERVLAGPLRLEAEEIMTTAKQRTPVDTGVLRASGVVRSPDIRPGKVTVELGFGGAARAYALAVHEHPSRHSPPTWSGGVSFRTGGPKFLESAVRDAERGFGRRIARRVDLFK